MTTLVTFKSDKKHGDPARVNVKLISFFGCFTWVPLNLEKRDSYKFLKIAFALVQIKPSQNMLVILWLYGNGFILEDVPSDI